jgi:hypothetical protein
LTAYEKTPCRAHKKKAAGAAPCGPKKGDEEKCTSVSVHCAADLIVPDDGGKVKIFFA